MRLHKVMDRHVIKSRPTHSPNSWYLVCGVWQMAIFPIEWANVESV